MALLREFDVPRSFVAARACNGSTDKEERILRMLNLFDSVRAQCGDLDPALLLMHFSRLATSYFERYSAAEVARHVRLLAGLTGPHPVDVDLRPLAPQAFEVVVVGEDHPGTVACITAALAAFGFDLEDVQVSPYLDPEPRPDGTTEPTYFV